MIDFSRISKGRVDRPAKVLIYGLDGIGKTSVAASAPSPFFLDANRGSLKCDVSRVFVENWGDTSEWLTAIENGQVKCESVVLDSITDFEGMSHAALFPGSTVDKHDGGYGRGDNVVIGAWKEMLNQLERIIRQGKTVIFVAHAMVKKFEDPTVVGGYERFEVGCRPKLAGLLRQWSDYVLFCREDVTIAAEKNKGQKARTTGARYMYTRRCPAWDAKARGSTLFPERIALSWSEFMKEVKNDEGRTKALEAEIGTMLAELADEALSRQVRGYIKEHPDMLSEAHNRVLARLEEARSKKEEGAQS